METKILIFETYNSLDYWFRQIATFLFQKQINCKVRKIDRKIQVGKIEIVFGIKGNMTNIMVGRHYSKLFFPEKELEENFEKSLREILTTKE